MAGRILTKIALSLAGLLLAAPAEAAVVDVTGTSAKLGWTAAAGAVTSYGVFVSRNGSAFPVSPDQVVATPEATVIAAAGDTLIVKVAAYDANGTKGPDSASSDSLHFVAAAGPPPDPAPAAPVLSVSTSTMTVSAVQGANPPSQSFTISNTGGGTLGYLTAYSHEWLVLSNSAGTVTTETDTVGVAFATAALPAGSYTGTVTVVDSEMPPREWYITVNLTVTAPPPAPAAIGVSPASIAATVQKGQSPAPQSFSVRNAGGGTLSYAITDNASWLSASPASGTSTGEADSVALTFSTASLNAGTYTANVSVSAAGTTSQVVPVTLTVTEAPASITLSTASLSATVQKGQSPAAASFTVANGGGGTLSYAVTESASWLSVSPASGTSTGEADAIGVSYSAASLAAGTYSATITVAGGAGVAAKTIAVGLTVTPGSPTLEVSTSSLDAGATPGQSPSAQSFTVRNAGDGTLSYAIASDQSWVTLSPASGTSTGEADTIAVSFSTASLAAGTHQATLTVSAAGLASKSVSVSVRIAAAGVSFDVDGDGTSDALFRHTDGTVSGWLVSGGAVRSSITPRTLDASWTLAGTGDFDGDGKSFDFLWVQPSTGAVTISLNSGSAQKALGSPGQVGAGWRVGGVADFDGDGKSDVLWIDPATGDVSVWLIDRVTPRAERSIGTLASGWDVVATGDFDGDHKADVVLQHGDTQELMIWLVDGAVVRQSLTMTIPAGGTVAAAGDFNGDGKADIAVFARMFGLVWILYGNGSGFSPTSLLWWTSPFTVIAAAGDYDADGKDDLLVHDPSTGILSTWLVGDGYFKSTAAVGTMDASWTAIGEKGTTH